MRRLQHYVTDSTHVQKALITCGSRYLYLLHITVVLQRIWLAESRGGLCRL